MVLPHTKPPWPVDAASAVQMESHALQHAKDFLATSAAKFTAMGYQARSVSALGTPVDGILQEAQAMNADLVLLGSRGRQGLTRVVLGSVSHAILHQATYPVLISG
jgi:nucleotide-binding universal stress UspA family protein